MRSSGLSRASRGYATILYVNRAYVLVYAAMRRTAS